MPPPPPVISAVMPSIARAIVPVPSVVSPPYDVAAMSVIHTRVRNDEIQAGGNRFARALDRAGIGARGKVAVLLPNVVEFLWVYRGCAWSGRRFTPLSWRWSIDEAKYVVDNCEADVVVAHARFADIARHAAVDIPDARRIAVGGAIEGFRSYEEFVAGCSTDVLEQPLAGDTMLYTSGTTGRPKGVLRPMAADMPPPSRVGRGGMMMLQTYLGGEPDRVHLVAAPLYHSGPVSYCEGASLLGADVVLMDGWDASTFLELVELHSVTSTFVVPIHFVRLLKLPHEMRARYDLSSLRLVVHGAAPTAVEVKRKMIEWLGPIVFEFYGGTEGGGISISSTEWLRKPGSVGRPYNPAVQIHILDDDGEPCAAGVEGAVYFRQPDAVTYKDDPRKDKRCTSRRSLDARRHRISRRRGLSVLVRPPRRCDRQRGRQRVSGADRVGTARPPRDRRLLCRRRTRRGVGRGHLRRAAVASGGGARRGDGR